MFVLGLGLGMVMQVLVLAVQNAVDYSDLGVATSGATLFRSIGGSVGTAILGSIFAAGLKSNLQTNLRTHPAAVAGLSHAQIGKLSGAVGNPASLKRLPTGRPRRLHHLVHQRNRACVPGRAPRSPPPPSCSAGCSRNGRCATTAEASAGISETFAAPKPPDSLAELSRALSVLLGHEGPAAAGRADRGAGRGSTSPRPRPGCSCASTDEPGRRVEDASSAWDIPLERAQQGLQS